MAKRKSDSSIESLASPLFILAILFIAIFYIIKLLLEVIIYILRALALLIVSIISFIDKKKAMVNINKSTIIKDNSLNEEEVRDKLKLFNRSIYNSYFEKEVRTMGEIYYLSDKISMTSQNGNKFMCKKFSKNTYDTMIMFSKENDGIIEEATCSCLYFKEKKKYCKHIYALMLNAKADNNNQIITNEIKNYIKGINKALDKASEYLKSNESKYSKKNRKLYYDYAKKKKQEMDNLLSQIDSNIGEENLLVILKHVMKLATDVEIETKVTIENEIDIKEKRAFASKKTTKDDEEDNIEEENVEDDLFLSLALLNSFDSKKKKSNQDEDLELEMDVYNLEDWQKDLVRQGKYKPWNFSEEDNFDESDYYHRK